MRQKHIKVAIVMIGMVLGLPAAVAGTNIEKPGDKTYEQTNAVYISYTKPSSIYKKAHKKCKKFFKRGIASEATERTTYSVEILNIVPKIKKASALCVAKKYRMDDVTKVAGRR